MGKRRTRPSLDSMVRELYGSLGEEMRLDKPMHRFGAIFRSHISGLHVEDFGSHRGRLTIEGDVGSREFIELSEAYSNRWNGKNLWMERSLDGFRKQGWQHGDAVVGNAELRSSEYYRHFLKPLDIRHGLGICIWADGPLEMAVASFHRGHGDREFGADDLRLAEQVRPHLVNVYAIYRRLAKLEGALNSFRSCFDRSQLGMMMLAADGRMLEANGAAHEALARAGILIVHGRELAFPPAHRRRYAEALRVLGSSAIAPARSLIIECVPTDDEVPRRIALHMCALPAQVLPGTRANARVLVCVTDLQPGQSGAADERVLCELLGLTPMEARVVLTLRRHVDVASTATSLNLSIHTARAHLRSVHERLGVHRTSGLLQLVERLIGSLPKSL